MGVQRLGNRPDASQAKNDLAARLAKRLRIKSLKDHTEWRNPLFEKWIFKFTGQPRELVSLGADVALIADPESTAAPYSTMTTGLYPWRVMETSALRRPRMMNQR